MKGLLTKDFLTIKKKYGLPRVIMDIAIIIALMFILEKSGTIYISFLLIPIEIMSMIISLTTCDEQWKWGKYAVSLPVSKKTDCMQQICLCGYFVLNWLCGCTHCKFCLIYSVSTICIWFLSLYVLCFICTDIIVFGICFAIKLLVRC